MPDRGHDLPDWVPQAARHYLDHVGAGRSIRALARESGMHASTVSRQVRRIEERREDRLVDAAISALSASTPRLQQELHGMSRQERSLVADTSDLELEREGRRVLRRLQEPGAVMAVAPDMDKAVVVRDTPDGRTVRTAVLDRAVAEAMALKEWIEPTGSGRVQRYCISAVGRAALKRLIAQEESARAGFSEAATPFADQHREWGQRPVGEGRGKRVMVRYNIAESPVQALARRRDKEGEAFLSDELLAAAERIREDFELAQLGPKVTQNWERLLTGAVDESHTPAAISGPEAARARVSAALRDLGPGLGDVVLRCCCFLEGLETAEKRMGWSSRSGKIVLRIALQRLRRHYDETGGLYGVLIG
jgi:DNA-binding MarR family transcriptional regulator